MANDFPLFLTCCKRPFHAFSGLYNFRCVHYVEGDIRAYRTVVLNLFSNSILVILILKCRIGAGAGLRYHSALWYMLQLIFLFQLIFIFPLFQIHLHSLPYPKTIEK